MPRTLLLVPTGHGVGLTATCLGLVQALDQRGVDVGFFKPLAQPSPRTAGPERSTALIRLAGRLRPPDPIPSEEVEKFLSQGAIDRLMEDVVANSEPVVGSHEVVIVEGLVPATGLVYSSRVNLALAKALDADVVLVGAPKSGGGDGGAEQLADSMAMAAPTYRAGESARVVGAVVNRLRSSDPSEVEEYRHAIEGHDIRLVGAVPFRAELTWPRLRDVVGNLDVQVLNEGDSDRRVKKVIIGAQAVPGLLPVLQEGRLIVVPGDRDEVILSCALAAMNGTRITGLLLTAGVRPDARVWELCQPAMATGLPVLLTNASSYETATILHNVDLEVPADDAERARLVMLVMAEGFDPQWLDSVPTPSHVPRLSPPAFRRQLTAKAQEAARRIVLPEGTEPRTVEAAAICQSLGIARCVLLAAPEAVAAVAAGLGVILPEGIECIDPKAIADDYIDVVVEARRHKGVNRELARDLLADVITLGTAMVRAGDADGLVAGALHTTAATVRPALQLLGTASGARLVSSVFFMCLPDNVVIYGDCAVNPDPDAEDLADIAIQSASSAAAFGIEPRVAMISFSTGSSGAGSDVEKVAAATRLVRERAPDLVVDGPLQYDAAAIASVAAAKAPGSPVAGHASVFVFPDLNTGNTTYKAVQRSADVVSIGPMLQGLAKPVNDLSRGASVEDIVYTIALTAIQAGQLAAGTSGRQPGSPGAETPGGAVPTYGGERRNFD